MVAIVDIEISLYGLDNRLRAGRLEMIVGLDD